MHKTAVLLFTLSLGCCSLSDPGQAGLHYQTDLERRCHPAQPSRIDVSRWKAPGTCTNDCFRWTLTCANKKSISLQSSIHPQTSELQFAFYRWAPWSILAFLIPFIAYVLIVAVGSQFHTAVMALNALFMGYVGYAAYFFYSSVTDNPWGSGAALAAWLYPNPVVFASVIAIFMVVSARTFWDGCIRMLGKPNPPLLVYVDDPATAAAMSAALMPNVFEIDDPKQTAEYYRRETARMLALKSHFEGQTERARAYLKLERARVQGGSQ